MISISITLTSSLVSPSQLFFRGTLQSETKLIVVNIIVFQNLGRINILSILQDFLSSFTED